MRWLDRMLVLCTALVALVSVLPLGARLSWVLELTTHFRVQYLAVTAVLLALARDAAPLGRVRRARRGRRRQRGTRAAVRAARTARRPRPPQRRSRC